MEYNSSILEYKSFLAEQNIEQSKMERFINECVLTAEAKNTAKSMNVLNESVTDKIKEGFKKVIEFIGKMWGKFLEAMTNLVNGNRSYLEKYKDIILKKKLNPETTYTMFKYDVGLQNMIKTAAPVFNYEAMKEELKDADVFEAHHFKEIPKSDKTFNDRAKAYFRGGDEPVDIKATLINMTDVYNYCYNYESKMKPLLEKDLKEIKTAANSIATIIADAEKVKNADAAKPEVVANGESYDIYGNKKYYSYVYEAYVHELVINQGDTSSSSGNTDNNAAANTKNVNGEAPKKEDQTAAVKADTDPYEDQIKKAQTYLNICGGLLTAKQTVSEEMFKEYMQLIKAHVRDNVGTSKKDKSNDKVADAGTNYKNVVDKAFTPAKSDKKEEEDKSNK